MKQKKSLTTKQRNIIIVLIIVFMFWFVIYYCTEFILAAIIGSADDKGDSYAMGARICIENEPEMFIERPQADKYQIIFKGEVKNVSGVNLGEIELKFLVYSDTDKIIDKPKIKINGLAVNEKGQFKYTSSLLETNPIKFEFDEGSATFAYEYYLIGISVAVAIVGVSIVLYFINKKQRKKRTQQKEQILLEQKTVERQAEIERFDRRSFAKCCFN